MHLSASHTVRLRPGGCRMLRFAAGTEVTVVHGAAQLVELCRSVAGHVHSPTVTLEHGAPHRIEADGWVALRALANCELKVSAPAPFAVRLAGALNALRRTVAASRVARLLPRS